MFERLREGLERALQLGRSWGRPFGGDDGVTVLRDESRRADPADIGRLRRERQRLLKARERAVRDLGGLALEMVRRDAFKPDLLRRKARDILSLEDNVHDVTDALSEARRAVPDPTIGTTTRCACGSSSDRAALFCSSCGRSLRHDAGVGSCDHCGAPLPGDAQFCPACGTASETTQGSPTGAGW